MNVADFELRAVRDMCFACFVAGKNDMPEKDFEEMFERLVNNG